MIIGQDLPVGRQAARQEFLRLFGKALMATGGTEIIDTTVVHVEKRSGRRSQGHAANWVDSSGKEVGEAVMKVLHQGVLGGSVDEELAEEVAGGDKVFVSQAVVNGFSLTTGGNDVVMAQDLEMLA